MTLVKLLLGFGLILALGQIAVASWWEHGIFYQIYPRSFKDSDGDGVGDINGIIEKLDYLNDLGITGLWLSPIFKSPMVDFGYDISDFENVDPIFGTNADLENLFATAKEYGIKIILDFVPNHTSDQHEWFIKSKASDPVYKDYYVWVDSPGNDEEGNRLPPNNWQSVFYGSAWEWVEERQQFYLHQFDKGQPDLNYRNLDVVQAMKDVMIYWLDKGADGFRLDAVNHMFETESYPDEPINSWATDPLDYGYTDHIHTKDLNETFEMVYEWRRMVEDYRIATPGDDVILMVEAYANTTFTHLFYGNGAVQGAHFPFNFKIMQSAYDVREGTSPAWTIDVAIRDWIDPLQAGEVSNWVLGNHDNKRVASQFGEGRINVLHTLTMTLPGVAITYNGEEIGMVDNYDITYEQTQDPQACNRGDPDNYNSISRDPARTPFQWDNTTFAGFTTGTLEEPWLPINSNYQTLNLLNQIDDPNSPYRYYKRLVELRKDKVFVEGDHRRYVFNDRVIAIERFTETDSYTILLNFGDQIETIDLTPMAAAYPENVEVLLASPESITHTTAKLNTNGIQLNPYESLVIKPFYKVDGEMDWWRNGLFYQIYPRSFRDSDGDGIGDINGIIEKLEYLQQTGVVGIWLSPVFKSPMADFGYDISDFREVDSIFGTNDDLTRLFEEAKALGIKIILDFVPNHTSDQHDWFIKSKARDPQYDNYYIWAERTGADDGKPTPPNNWQSVFYGSAWEWDEGREQFYLHQFDKSQPDLNYRNPAVVQDMKNVITYWLDKGAAGFRMDAVNHMFETEGLPNEPTTGWTDDPLDYGYTDHIYTKDLSETYDMIYQFRELCDEYQKQYGGDERIIMTEAYTNIPNTHLYYGDGVRLGGQVPFNFGLINKIDEKTAKNFDDVIHEWIDVLEPNQIPNWVLGNHDQNRFASRYGEQMVNVLHTLTMTLPGVAITYNGEEIGMVDNYDITYEETVDPQACNRGDPENYLSMSRDPERTPFQWDDTLYAGFSTGEKDIPWLPVNSNYKDINLKSQQEQENSVYKFYQQLVQLRKHPIMLEGDFKSTVLSEYVLAFSRTHSTEGTYVILMNLGSADVLVNFTNLMPHYPNQSTVILAAPNSEYDKGSIVNTNNTLLRGYESLILKPEPQAAQSWWEHGIFYQIYPRSFKDSDGDGVGDINGIIEKLDYLSDLGITGLWLSPIFKSPMVDFGYDISDFENVDPIFGTNADLEDLFATAKEYGIKIILDFVPNHTSDQHEWFIKSKASDPVYKDYYVWVDSPGNDEEGNRLPPNNWQSVFYGSAWEWVEERQQFYLHQFDKGQPDLNYRNLDVVQAMKDVMIYWLDKGADGFRLDAVNHMFETESYPDEPINSWATDPLDYGYTDHIHTKDLNETFEMVYEWRRMVEDYRIATPGDDVILMVEAYANTTFTHLFYGNGAVQGAHFPFNFKIMQSAYDVREGTSPAWTIDVAIRDWIDPLQAGEVSNWVLGNHDNKRVASQFGEGRINVLHTLTMTLPGVAITYNGEEIGMVDNYDITYEQTQDPQACNRGDPDNYNSISRDPARTPFQWDNTTFAGFTTGTLEEPWLPINSNYQTLNLLNQIDDPNSPYRYYKRLVELRKDKVFVEGDHRRYVFNDRVIAIERFTETDSYTILLNFGDQIETIDLTPMAAAYPENVEVLLASPESITHTTAKLNTNGIQLNPYESLVIKPFYKVDGEMDWWRNGLFYQIYPRSFRDSDGDGIGDINGIIEKLEYLQQTGVVGIWLSPVFKSPMADFGYDISDFREVDSIFGTNDDLTRLFEEAKALGIKIILDFVPNHTSDQHDWFIKSKARDPQYDNYYIWAERTGADDGKPTPPNNWQSVFYGSAWEWDEGREQFYLHQFDKSQPDLNYRNPAVVQDMKNVITYWLDKGAAGFRMDAVNHMFETEGLPNEPTTGWTDDPLDYGYTDHIYTKDLSETYDMIYQFRELCDEYQKQYGGDERIIMTEAYTNIPNTHLYYGDGVRLGGQVPFNFGLINKIDEKTAKNFDDVIHEWIDVLEPNQIPNWVLGNHDQNRFASRYGEQMVNVLHTLTMTLPGVAITYNGEEIGMVDNYDITYEETVDPQACNRGDPENYLSMSRDPERTPFQWDDTLYAGFSTGEKDLPWLPVNSNYKDINLKIQQEQEKSVYKFYQQLVQLRKHPIMLEGDFKSAVLSEYVLAFSRTHSTEGTYVILMNLGSADVLVNFTNLMPHYPNQSTVILAAPNSEYDKGSIVNTNNTLLRGYESLILKPEPQAAQSWWEHGIFYQIYPRSFKDSDGDGVGDINGIIEKLDYLSDLGITGLWLSPIFQSPMVDAGYDISDFENVDPIFGTNADLEDLFATAREYGIKIILDFVPNHTSDQHEWFIKSKANDPVYKDYYVWVDSPGDDEEGNRLPPNNWQSLFYGSAWEWVEERQQFYLHQFDKGQPDLNYRNLDVVQAMKDVMIYWLDKGADGFRLDAVNFLFETESYPDEPVNSSVTDPLDYGYTDHIHTKDLNETFEMVYEWRRMVEDYRIATPGDDVVLMVEAYANTTFTHLFYGNGAVQGAHFPFNFKIMQSAYDVREGTSPAWTIDVAIRDWIDPLQAGEVSNWVLGNHDNKRAASQFGEGRINVLHTLTMTLPGVAITYNGEEIGMVDNYDITYEQTQDPQACNRGDPDNYNSISRDPARTPFQWSNFENAGFTSSGATPWLPINKNYPRLNLLNQIDDPNSPYRYYKRLVQLRKDKVFVEGDHRRYVFNDRVIAIERFTETDSYTILLNFGDQIETIDLTLMSPAYPERVEVIFTSPESSTRVMDKLYTNGVQLNPYESLVFKPFFKLEDDGEMDWWRNGLFYQIYPRSFKDSDGDGIGDINGIIEKLEYLRQVGVIGIWLSPVFKSPMADFGYDISDFREVDSIFGSNDDLTRLFQEAKAIGIKIILDFVPNHTSDQHEWFLKSKARDPQYDNYYIWEERSGAENGNPTPPNNWQSVFYGSAWEWDEGREQFYLHQFDKSQPDLNYRNPAVVQEMKDVLSYWLDKGAAGFRMDAVSHMFETEGLPNEPRTMETDDPLDYGYTDHIYTKELPETYDMIYQFRELCDEYKKTYGGDERIMMTEAYTNIANTHLYYGDGVRLGGQVPFNFGLITKISERTAKNFNDVIHEWIDLLQPNQTANWVLGNHDQNRFASRYGEQMVNVLHTLTMTLPGVVITYNGEEIGMVDNYDISYEETVDPQACNKGDPDNYISLSRDPARTPFQWDDTLYAGFSTGENGAPWLPVNSNYKRKNLKIQQEQEKSVFKFYQELVKLRKDPIMLEGDFKSVVLAEYVLAFSRTHPTEGTYVILMNLGSTDEVVDITNFVADFPERSIVMLAVPDSELGKGSIVNTNSTLLRRYESLILKPKIEAEIRDKDWWETAVFYQIYPRSFKDSNGDGVGDIGGIIDKLDHLHDIGVTATWLSPVLESPMADFGYDISDFKNVDPLFGTNADLDELFEKAKELGIRVIMDFVPNHTSDEHEWFKQSVKRVPPYDDYYVWHDGKLDENGKRIPPNNWVSVFYGHAWTWNKEREQYYLHQFDKKQPDLNYRNQNVRDEMKDILRYWLDKGAAGFRMDAVNHIMEVEDLRDDPRNPNDNDNESFGYVYHHYTVDMKETYDLIYEFREYIDQWMEENKPDEVKIMMTEAYTNISNTMLYYQSEDHRKVGAHFPFNFILIEWLNENSDAPKFKETIETWLNNVPDGRISNWVLGNHDKPRVGSRYGSSRIDSLNTLSMTLPGVAVTYNGDEIGMVDYRDISYKDTLDPQACNRGDPMDYKWSSRDPQRTPFQWDDSDYAGFTTGEDSDPWLPVHLNYKELNLANQKEDPRSHYNLYKQLVQLRKHNTMIHGDVTISAINNRVLTYIRELEGSESFVIVINLGDFWETIDLNKLKTLPAQMTVVTSSGESKHVTNNVITTNSLVLGPHDALVLSTSVVVESSSVTFGASIMLVIVAILISLF